MRPSDPVILWLLEEENPPVRFLTLTGLLHQSETSSVVRQARLRLMDYKVTREILRHGKDFWQEEDGSYRKYTGKYWQIIFLGQFLADGADPQIREGVLTTLEKRKWVTAGGGQCLTANLLTAFRRLGFADHPLVIEETETLARRIVTDGGLKCSVMDYSLLRRCYMALPKQLLLFAEVPPDRRSESIRAAVNLIVQTLLENSIYRYVPSAKDEWQKILQQAPKKDQLPEGQTVKEWISRRKERFRETHDPEKREAKPGWLKFGFPLHYNSDILEAMYALTRLKVPVDPAFSDALQIIRDRMRPDGRWAMDTSLNGKMWADVEEKGKPSKWITYLARYVLDYYR